MKVFMTGGTGFVGTYLSRELAQAGHAITILSRRAHPSAPPRAGISFLTGDPTQEGPWMALVPEHDWIINLAGASIFDRWTEARKKEIMQSRERTTRNLVAALTAGDRRQLFCSTSAVGIYGPRGEEELTEDSPTETGFLGEVTKTWEAEALKAQDLGVRVVVTRFGVVLGRNGGALSQMAPLFKKFLGGPIGSGVQWFSWIHQADLARAFRFIQENPQISGPVNFTAPNPVRNRDLARALGRVLHRPSFMPTPAFMLRLVLGEFADTLLTGQKVLPKRLLDAGFTFEFPTVDAALADLLGGG
ncbi:MAG: TIGR01777 family oxidoreductase [Deltaproteobacteria bacterium]|nr:TIGR01777 family oxidoreductase [Deltaproteobacteria bacterium]